MKRRTRNYAKRQLAWMRRLPDVHRIDLTDREPDDGRRRDRPYTAARQCPEEEERPVTRATVPIAVLAAFAALAPSAYAVRDFSSTARNIIPSGQWGASRSRPARRRPTRPPSRRASTTASRRCSTTSRTTTSTATSSPRSSARRARGRSSASPSRARACRIIRDRFNVPHIYGKTNDDVTWGAGWALGARPRAAARAGALQRARGRGRRARPDCHRPDRRPQDLQSERADRARGAEGGRQAQALRQARPAACCTTSTCS